MLIIWMFVCVVVVLVGLFVVLFMGGIVYVDLVLVLVFVFNIL